MMPNLNGIVELARTVPLVAIRWDPTTDSYSDATPVAFVKAAGNALAWFPAYHSNATGDVVRQVVPTGQQMLRADLSVNEAVSVVFRPATPAEADPARAWFAASARLNMEAQVEQKLLDLQTRAAEPKRDKLFSIAYWTAFDRRINKDVPAGVVIPTEGTQSLEWVALPGWEDYAQSRNDSIDGGLADPLAVLVDLAERAGQNHSSSYPEYVRAADRDDAITIGLNNQRRRLSELLGSPT